MRSLYKVSQKNIPQYSRIKKKVQLTAVNSVNDLVQQVRSRLYDDIQRLHGTMPLWGVDR